MARPWVLLEEIYSRLEFADRETAVGHTACLEHHGVAAGGIAAALTGRFGLAEQDRNEEKGWILVVDLILECACSRTPKGLHFYSSSSIKMKDLALLATCCA